MNNNPQKKFKRPKQQTFATTNPDARRDPPQRDRDIEDWSECPEHVCALIAKDSEWVDIVQTPFPDAPNPSSSSVGDEEALLQLVDCENGPESERLAIMFPGLLEKDPQTFQGMLTKAMSTTEVTKNLVDLGAKANFQFMKKSNKLIPRDKQWLEKVNESDTSQSHCSFESNSVGSSPSSSYDADNENGDEAIMRKKKKKILISQEKGSTSHNYSGKPFSDKKITPNSSNNNQKDMNTIRFPQQKDMSVVIADDSQSDNHEKQKRANENKDGVKK